MSPSLHALIPGTGPRLGGLQRNALAGRFHLLMIAAVWTGWLVLGGRSAVGHFVSDWRVSLTMIVGSFVGGSTSIGGGAIAFPVFTKVLHVAPRDARDFSMAIQSIGMSTATLSILFLRIPIERRAFFYAGVPGIAGVTIATFWIAPYIPPALVRVIFTVLICSMGVALLLANRGSQTARNLALPSFGLLEKMVLCTAGLLGGVLTGLIGTGENTVLFIVLVLLFRLNEKVVTPTTVVLMTMVTIPGFLLHLFFLKDLTPAVMNYWIAAVPVVVVMGPLGVLTCSRMRRKSVVNLLLVLIALECVSTACLVTFTRPILSLALGGLVVFGSVEVLFSRIRLYLPELSSCTAAMQHSNVSS